uniref:Putative tick defensin n=1 Tax=Rhipicephalus pulchellus TaxID=72859 RepID=L7MA04_RHIPC
MAAVKLSFILMFALTVTLMADAIPWRPNFDDSPGGIIVKKGDKKRLHGLCANLSCTPERRDDDCGSDCDCLLTESNGASEYHCVLAIKLLPN